MRTQAEFEAMFNCKAPAGQTHCAACLSCRICLLAASSEVKQALLPHQYNDRRCNLIACMTLSLNQHV